MRLFRGSTEVPGTWWAWLAGTGQHSCSCIFPVAGEQKQENQTQAAWLVPGGKDPAAPVSVILDAMSWVAAFGAFPRAPPSFSTKASLTPRQPLQREGVVSHCEGQLVEQGNVGSGEERPSQKHTRRTSGGQVVRSTSALELHSWLLAKTTKVFAIGKLGTLRRLGRT